MLGSTPIAGFGSSDCDCESHLFFFEALPSLHMFTAGLTSLDRGHPRVLQVRWLTNGTSRKD